MIGMGFEISGAIRVQRGRLLYNKHMANSLTSSPIEL